MKILKRLDAIRTALAVVLALAACVAGAQYPNKPVRVIVPFLAGGSADTLARTVAPKLSTAWGQPIVVENRGGAGGNVGAEIVAKAPGDGYTLLFTPPPPLAINMHLYKNMPFDPFKDFAPVSVVGVMPNVLVVGPRVAAANLQEFLAFAKANSGEVSYGSQGVGSTPHLTGAMLARAANIDIVHVPYKGFPPILADLLGARLDFAFLDASNVLPQLKGGRIRALAVASAKRYFALADTPTLVEAGFADFVSATWMSFAAPAGTPPEVGRKWREELQRAVRLPDVQQRFADLGVEVWVSSAEEMASLMETESRRWSEVIRLTGARND